jgi:hypothetical protein
MKNIQDIGNSLFLFSSFHGFGRGNYNFVAALRTNVSLAAGTGKTVTARFFQMRFFPCFSAMGAAYE